MIRRATTNDLADLVAIYNHAIEERATADLEVMSVAERRDWLDRHRSERYPILVHDEGGVVGGWSSLSLYREGRAAVRGCAEISYYVHRDHRRRGLGAALVEATIERAREIGFRDLLAILLANNEASVRLLEKFGFEKWGLLPKIARFDETEVSQLIYGRRIDGSDD